MSTLFQWCLDKTSRVVDRANVSVTVQNLNKQQNDVVWGKYM
jgi:hypothetical protein